VTCRIELNGTVAITFVGRKNLPVDWLKKTFRVRRRVVYQALLWLRNHNPIYADISIDSDRLEELPEDGVPQELLMVIRHEEDEELAEKERESYLSADVGGDDMNDLEKIDDDDGKWTLFVVYRHICLV
jgi:hypothetical protein